MGESWEVSDVGDDSTLHSVVADGSDPPITLRELLREDPPGMLGESMSTRDGEVRLPLLFKYIDAREALSVQVHPTDDLAAKLRLDGGGKSEAWIVLDASPGATIIYGLEDGLSFAEYVKSAGAGRGAEGLRRVPVRRGDIIYLPAGTLHAIGAGVLLAEIQQSSDHTFRLYDWDRLGLDGRPRRLHLEEARLVSPPHPLPPCPLPAGKLRGLFTSRLEGAPFTLEELRSDARMVPWPDTRQRFAIFSLLEGRALLETGLGEKLPLRPGDVLFVPAAVAAPCLLYLESPVWGLWMQPAARIPSCSGTLATGLAP